MVLVALLRLHFHAGTLDLKLSNPRLTFPRTNALASRGLTAARNLVPSILREGDVRRIIYGLLMRLEVNLSVTVLISNYSLSVCFVPSIK